MNSRKIVELSPLEELRSKRTHYSNGKNLRDFVVTVTQDHFVTVMAPDEEEAGKRAVNEILKRWGGGRNPQVTEIEEMT